MLAGALTLICLLQADPYAGWRKVGVTTEAVTTPYGPGLKATFSPRQGANPWDHLLGFSFPERVNAGDTVFVSLRVRSDRRQPATAFFELGREPHTKFVSGPVSAGPEWREFAYAARVPQALGPNEGQFTLFLGFEPGGMEVADVRVRNAGPVDPATLPTKALYYLDGEPDDAWRAEAERRIELIRKAPLTIRVVDAKGRPVPNARVAVRQQRHAFKFGAAAPASRINEQTPDGAKFRATLERLFNTVTFENDLKWNSLSPSDHAEARRALEWLRARKFHVRGHNLVWGSKRWMPAEAWALDDVALRQAILDRVDREVKFFGKDLYLWDVVNEAATERELWDRLGWPLFAEAFKAARKADPKVQLCYNDFNITETDQAGDGQKNTVKQRVQVLLNQGAPVNVIGVQAHVGAPITPMPRVLQSLDEMAKFGLPLEITEYDLGVQDNVVHGRHMADFLTAAFSHPAMQAFVMWGFWEKSHWRAQEGGAMFRADWTPRPAAREYERLVKGVWWTKADGRADRAGRYAVRAFKGTQAITVITGGKRVTRSVEVEGPTELKVRL